MARRRKTRTRRRSRSISILNLAQTYLYANVLTQGAMSGSPLSVITGEADAPGSWSASGGGNLNSIYDSALSGSYTDSSWAVPISLRDLINTPSQSLAAIQGNVARNVIPMMVQSAMIGVSFKLGKRLLRKPLNATNRGLKMALGAGIKL